MASNPAHGWMRATRQAVLLLALQLWHCLGLTEEPALEEALRGDDECNATWTGGICQVEMMQLRAATRLMEEKEKEKETEKEKEKEKEEEEEKEKEKEKEKELAKKNKEKTQKRKNHLQKKWAADIIANLDPGICQKEMHRACSDFDSFKVFKVQCGGIFQRYCAASEETCRAQHMENAWSIVMAPLNFYGLGKIRKALKIAQKATREEAIQAFKLAVKKEGKKVFKKWHGKVKMFMRPRIWGRHMGRYLKEKTMEAITMGGAMEFTEMIGRKENSAEEWLRDALEFADPTGLTQVWRTFEKEGCAETHFRDMPIEGLEAEYEHQAEEGDEEEDEKGRRRRPPKRRR